MQTWSIGLGAGGDHQAAICMGGAGGMADERLHACQAGAGSLGTCPGPWPVLWLSRLPACEAHTCHEYGLHACQQARPAPRSKTSPCLWALSWQS